MLTRLRIKYLWIFVTRYIITCGFTGTTDAVIVSFPLGNVLGQTRYATGSPSPVYEFLGIPYAQPPVGDLRFRPPQPLRRWTGVLEATKIASLCMQDLNDPLVKLINFTSENFSEDCLFLNVYTKDMNASRPVVVAIHGGKLIIGAAAIFNGTALVAYEDVVLVTVSYRLGALGFLSTGDDRIPPNLGMQDQQLALRWVRDYISYFGGDPKQVTLYGESAGSWSVNFHVLSPISGPLFHKAFHMSGSLFSHRVLETNPQSTVDEMAVRFNCSDRNDVVSCLRKQPAYSIVTALPSSRWVVTVDPVNIPGDPVQLFTLGSFNRVPSIFLSMSIEGAAFLSPAILQSRTLNRDDLKVTIRDQLSRYRVQDERRVEAVVDRIADFYLAQGPNNWEFYINQIAEVIGDVMFVMPMVQVSRKYREYAPTYYGEFSYRRSNSPLPAWVTGAIHADAIPFLFGRDLMDYQTVEFPPNVKFNDVDKALSRRVMRYFGNFIHRGTPNDESFPEWPLFTEASEQYMRFDADPTVQRGFNPDTTGFLWNTIDAMINTGRDVTATSVTVYAWAFLVIFFGLAI